MMSCMAGHPESPEEGQYLVLRVGDLENLPNNCDIHNPHCQAENRNLQDDYDERIDELTFRYEERITELHSVIAELRKKIERHQINVIREEDEDEICKKMEDFSFEPVSEGALSGGLRPATFHPPPPPPPNEFPDPGYLQEEITLLRTENGSLQVTDHQSRLQGYEGPGSPVGSRTSTPTKQPLSTNLERPGVNITPMKASDNFPVAKVAELKKLKTSNIAEHLVQSLWKGSNLQEIVQNATEKSGLLDVDSRVTEFEIELERLQSQIDNYKAQMDVLNLTLDESKANCDKLTVLMGKYESNNTALQIVLNYGGLCIETYEIICALLESELGVVLANCRAAGIGSLGGESFMDDQGEITSILQRAHQSRRAAENVSKHLIHKLDRSFNVGTSFTTSSSGRQSPGNRSNNSSSGFCDAEFTKTDERRLRDYIHRLKHEQSKVEHSVQELESIHSYTDAPLERRGHSEAQRLDLENAVIMQELMAMKVAELVGALEKLSRNSEVRHQQSAEFINDLKRANSALISAFDKAKKKYQGKLKKLESQMQSLTERYEAQIRMMKQKLSRIEDETKQRVANETDLALIDKHI
ncbi:CRCM-like protein [Mya arenaria]|uniref:CRCM-like protein n=1 Tax=Mya arenaria TaxID=6604 RepID=A0ABY7G659_MYAAR|nr:CRCM-like protein [Mya arenaria]